MPVSKLTRAIMKTSVFSGSSGVRVSSPPTITVSVLGRSSDCARASTMPGRATKPPASTEEQQRHHAAEEPRHAAIRSGIRHSSENLPQTQDPRTRDEPASVARPSLSRN